MRAASYPGFIITSAALRADILIPRYYDPRLEQDLHKLASDHSLVPIEALVSAGLMRHDQGNYIPKIHYGSGPYPYIRTSDIANWELKASPKHGVAQEIFEQYSSKQDVQPGDILFVHEGTYLIGAAAMVTPFDGPLLFQHHLARFRVKDGAPFGSHFFLAALESPIVRRQIRSKQFSADIIDSVVGRMGEVVIPVPRDQARVADVEATAEVAILGRAETQQRMTHVVRELDANLRGKSGEGLAQLFDWRPVGRSHSGQTAFLGQRRRSAAYTVSGSDIVEDILLPRYYDPAIQLLSEQFAQRCDLLTIADLSGRGLLSLNTGDEVGKMQYGSGGVAFLRTSDLGSWELKRNPKQGVSMNLYQSLAVSQDLGPGDVLLVRDGTYLVGSSVLVSQEDLPALYCGGLIRIRSLDQRRLPPALLLAILNLPFVRQQMRSKQFTRDVIDTLGNRFQEVVLPIPRDEETRSLIADRFAGLIAARNTHRSQLVSLVESLYPQHV